MRKGFALPFILLILTIFLIASAGIFYFNQSTKNKEEAKIESVQCAKPIENNQTTTQITEGRVSKSILLTKMGKITNYQLDRTVIYPNSTVHSKFLRAGDKLASFSETTSLIDYVDIGKCKEYIFSPPGEFIEAKDVFDPAANISISDNFELGTPKYYLNNLPEELVNKPAEKFNDNDVDVYEGLNLNSSDVLITIFIYQNTGLPAKIISKNTKLNKELTQEFIFSRIGQIQESEVSVPTSAKKISKQQYDKVSKMHNSNN